MCQLNSHKLSWHVTHMGGKQCEDSVFTELTMAAPPLPPQQTERKLRRRASGGSGQSTPALATPEPSLPGSPTTPGGPAAAGAAAAPAGSLGGEEAGTADSPIAGAAGEAGWLARRSGGSLQGQRRPSLERPSAVSLGVPEEEQLWEDSAAEGSGGVGISTMPPSPWRPQGRTAASPAPPRLRQLSPRRSGGFRPSAAAIPEGVPIVESLPYNAIAAGGGQGDAAAAGSPTGPSAAGTAGGKAAAAPQGTAADSTAGGDAAAAAAAESRESAEVGDEEEEQLPGEELPPPEDEKH